jgi:hypothetical protein
MEVSAITPSLVSIVRDILAISGMLCNGVVVDERTLCSAINNLVRQVGIR